MTPARTIQLDPQTAKAIADLAAIHGLTVEAYLKKQFVGTNGERAVEDVDNWLDQLTDGLNLPPLPRDFSAKDIYADHD